MNTSLATFLGFIAILMWSSCVAVVRSLVEALGVFTAGTAIYFVAAAMSLLGNSLRRGRITLPSKFNKKFLLLVGFLFVIDIVAFYLSVAVAADRRQLLEISLVNYLWPTLTVVFSIPILKNKADWKIVPGVLIVIFGIVLVTTQDEGFSLNAFVRNFASNPTAYLLALAAAVFWALYSNFNKLFESEGQEEILYVFILVTALALLPFAVIFDEPRAWSEKAIFETFFMALVVALGYEFWDIGTRKGNFVLVSILSYFTPVLATLFASMYLDVETGTKLWIGCGLIVSGAYLSERSMLPADRIA